MNKKILVLIAVLAVSLTACIPKQDNAIKELETEEIGEDIKEEESEKLNQEEQLEILKRYYEAIENNDPENQIINNVKENITRLDEEKADEMIIQLENYLYSRAYDAKEVIEMLEPFLENSSREFKSYFNIWKRETENETTDGEGLNISAEEIIERALEIEKYWQQYPESVLKVKLDDLYKVYMRLSLKGLDNPYIFAKEGESSLDPDLLEMYQDKIDKNPDTRTARILSQYLEELEKDSYDLNGENVNYFYDNTDAIIEATK